MKNIIFISPNFPTNYWQFCRELKNNGLNVLGIGDQPYDELRPELKNSLTEYYKVGSLENYDEVYRAVAFLTFKYGRIDWLESNNEYWLEQDAKLRTDFNITSGFQVGDLHRIKYKSGMKEYYEKAGIIVARYHLVEDIEGCRDFIAKVGYPVVVKPDNGVGAAHTYKLKSDEELQYFMATRPEGVPVNDNDNSIYYILKDLPEDTRAAGRAAVKSFGVKSRFIHFEFFRLTQDQEGLGKKGQIMALEVNMRPCGGFTPDMINYAHSTNVYQIWADMIAYDSTLTPVGGHQFCAFAGLRDGKNFKMSHEDIMAKYGYCMKMVDRLPDALARAMGNRMYVATFPSREALDSFYSDVLACW